METIVSDRSVELVNSLNSMCLTSDEVDDTLDYPEIESTMAGSDELYYLSGIFVGSDNGLCKSYKKPYVRAEEEM